MYIKPRGTNDIYFDEIDKFNYVCDRLKYLSNLYGFNQIITPSFEHAELFTKNIGESTDVVNKEIYTFYDKSDRLLALRPEGTAGVVRAFVENKLYGNLTNTLKFSYILNLFRYERPQKGRNREFYQFGVEYLGSNNISDVIESIIFANSILTLLGLKKYCLKINYLGSIEDRNKWSVALTEYFSKYKNELSEISQSRINTNPLRILDDKVDAEKDFVKNAPKLSKYLSNESLERFTFIQNALTQMGIKYEVDDTLVRGLDYYNDCVYEFVSDQNDIAKSTIIGGGCYNNLISKTGGPNMQGLGFAIGLERLIIALENENLFPKFNNSASVLIGSLISDNELLPLAIACKLRNNGIKTDLLYATKKAKINKYCVQNNINVIVWINNDFVIEIENINEQTKKVCDVNNLLEEIKQYVK